MYILSYDVGGTKIEASLFCVDVRENEASILYQNSKGEKKLLTPLGRKRCPTERSQGYEQLIGKWTRLAEELCHEAGISVRQLAGIGMGLPGTIDPLRVQMIKGSIFPLFHKDFTKDLRQALGLPESFPIFADNDANCFALAEVYCGAGLQYTQETGISVNNHSAIGIILGTGLGGGLVIKGKLYSGKHGGAGELGHTPLYPHGHACYCGRRGCAEQYLAGPALEAMFNSRLYSQIEKRPTAKEIFELAQQQEPAAIAVLNHYKHDLALFLGKLATIFDPDYFVFGGGLSNQPLLYEGLSQAIAGNAFLNSMPVPVYRNTLGDSAGIVGAAMLVLGAQP